MYTLITSTKWTISRKQFFLASLFRWTISIVVVIIWYLLIPENTSGDYITGMSTALFYVAIAVWVALTLFTVGIIPSLIKRLRECWNSTKRTWLRVCAIILPWLWVVWTNSTQLSFLTLFASWGLWILCLCIIVCMWLFLLLKGRKKKEMYTT